jgi:hypothetical protein
MAFVLEKLLIDVFDPEPGEVVLVVCDVPRPGVADSDRWAERRAMAAEWREAFAALGERRGFDTLELLTYPATGANGAELPAAGELGGQAVGLDDTLLSATLACLLTQFSATAALDTFCKRKVDFRAASMPGVERRMERSALSANYREVARRAAILEKILRGATALEVSFSTGHSCRFDLRFRTPEADDGFLPRGRKGDRIINLPSGETFIVPYEGERPGIASTTAGTIPVRIGPELVLFQVSANRIKKVEGTGGEARRLRAYFAADPARANIAEVAFGCNEWAQVTGNVLEDEKAGFHWAYGRSEHLGGTVGPSAFMSAETIVHQDVVYAKGNPVQIAEAVVLRPEGRTRVIRNGDYVVF